MRLPSAAAAAALAIVFLPSDGAGEPARPSAEDALPWLHDFPADAVAGAPSRSAEVWLRERPSPDAGCTTTSSASFALVAELAPAPGLETVLASYTAGVVVLDARGRELASAPPLPCLGSVDAIEGIATGELIAGEPAIALAATAGGRAERTTWLYFFARRGEVLAPIFAAPVEEWRGPFVSTGEVTVLPGGALRYRAPDGAISRWTYDRRAGRFVMRELIRPSPETMTGPTV
jgi:hypothetical protein